MGPAAARVRFRCALQPSRRQDARGSICRGLVDCYPAPRPPQVVTFQLSQMDRLLGFKIEPTEAIRILSALEYQIEPSGPTTLMVTVPTHRLDVQEGTADLVEDIVRIYGYDRVPTTLLSEPLPKQQANEPIVFEEKVRDILVDCGLQEVVCYALTMPQKEAPLLGARWYVTLKNPISSERYVMRQSVLAS